MPAMNIFWINMTAFKIILLLIMGMGIVGVIYSCREMLKIGECPDIHVASDLNKDLVIRQLERENRELVAKQRREQ